MRDKMNDRMSIKLSYADLNGIFHANKLSSLSIKHLQYIWFQGSSTHFFHENCIRSKYSNINDDVFEYERAMKKVNKNAYEGVPILIWCLLNTV